MRENVEKKFLIQQNSVHTVEHLFPKAQDFVNKAGEAFNAAEQELGSAFDEVKQSFTGNSANQQNAGGQYNGGYQNNGAGQYNAGYQNNGAGQYNTGYQNNGGQTPPPYRGREVKG